MPNAQDPIDLSELILTGQHPVVRIGAEQRTCSAHVLAPSSELHPSGVPRSLDVAVDRLRFSVGLDATGHVAYWVLKRSMQDHPFLFTAATRVVRLNEVDAFGLLRALEKARIPYTREIWQNCVCVITVLQSGVTIAFDLEPGGIKGFASIERAEVPLRLGGDVFHRATYA